MEDGMEERAHIVMVPTPGMGHLIPLTELARRLANSFNFRITILIPTTENHSPHCSISLNSLPSSISNVFLPPVDVSDLPEIDAAIETRILATLTRSIPAIRHWMSSSSHSTRLVALVVDLFGYPLFDLATHFNIKPYMFFLSSALGLCFAFKLPSLHHSYACQYKDIPEPIQLCPDSVPIPGSDFIDPVQDRNSPVYNLLLHTVQMYPRAAGFFVNTFHDLEPAALDYLMGHNNIPPIYPIGPLIQTARQEAQGGATSCLSWLDEQPHGSVLYVSFGSGGSLSQQQLTELAHGLELSGVRFLWVVKTPNDIVANSTYFTTVDSASEPLDYLPPGFIERTKAQGFVVPSWAPQIQVLSHGSMGGFLTHCGWNSILESVVHGVPFIAWPLFAEQKFNAVLLTQDLKVAIRVKPNEMGLVEREQVAKHVASLIQGEEGQVLRERMRHFKQKAGVALAEGGSFNTSLAQVAQVLMNHNTS